MNPYKLGAVSEHTLTLKKLLLVPLFWHEGTQTNQGGKYQHIRVYL